MNRFVGFTTYPTKLPIHGGQRRIGAFTDFYESVGVDYETVCVYEGAHYGPDQVGDHDVLLEHFETELNGVPFVSDLASGLFAAGRKGVREHFKNFLLSQKPQVLVLEQPFMWPLIRALRDHPEIGNLPVIYSSQNWEAPLKFDILLKSGVNRNIAQRISQQIESLEREIVQASQLVIAVSESDATIYRTISPVTPVVVVKNGVSRSKATISNEMGRLSKKMNDRYFFFVGSAYPPNVEGICDLLLDGGLFFVPPQKTFAICGGVSKGTFNDSRYRRFLSGNSERVQFFQHIEDIELDELKLNAHGVILPINYGGGSNLKTAEALASGKWVVATSTSLRGYEEFREEPGVFVADDRQAFRKAVMQVYRRPPLELSEEARIRRESVYWDRRFGHFHSMLRELNWIRARLDACEPTI